MIKALPEGTLTGEDRASLRNLSVKLKERVIGQDHAMDRVTARLIDNLRAGKPDKRDTRRAGAFLDK